MVPDSLCAQVLRAKYFADGKIFEAVEKPNISYSWRGLYGGLAPVKTLIYGLTHGFQMV